MATETDRWDVHEHKNELCVSNRATIYHAERGQLCISELHWDCVLSYPLQFKDKAAAYKWIESGTIAEIQESLGVLQVGFSDRCFMPRPSCAAL